ncbi:hypothetical protein [Vibrio panuliri]|uniref:Uncharacterized protein n=1 Tax=Vibrio panuliri TaxID=1381081 RepID=A0ABX3FM67_9VIBR|nr:hypothetical protein [Vibrio panuliri]KAB1454676.1 hypothetical protein F7O85_17590 [Vibrio panuliri]OLQ94139.1 hypothetical protein BIY20_07890 [Vibrio panuliri]
MTDIDIEFEHLMLEIHARRWSMVERFLFSYFCFRQGFLSKAGKPDWQTARDQSPQSVTLRSLKLAELEPVVPHQAIIGELKRYERDGELTRQTVQRILDSLLHYVVISKTEQRVLKLAGLADAMPPEWYQSGAKEPYARFKKLGIQFNL